MLRVRWRHARLAVGAVDGRRHGHHEHDPDGPDQHDAHAAHARQPGERRHRPKPVGSPCPVAASWEATGMNDAQMPAVAVLGAGKIGEALLSGLLSGGRRVDELMFTERHPEGAAELTTRYGVRGVDVATAAKEAGVLVVAVKPQDIEPVLDELAPATNEHTLIVSLCAGLPTALYERRLPAGVPVVRVMPNTPMIVGEAMSAISPGRYATGEHLAIVEQVLSAVGQVV